MKQRAQSSARLCRPVLMRQLETTDCKAEPFAQDYRALAITWGFALLAKCIPLHIRLSKVALMVNFMMQIVIKRGQDGRNGPLITALINKKWKFPPQVGTLN